ncbi:MAG TPA: rod shape-determining protein RodA [Syntrophomonadaceae bacterium]|nr:rod shape-determining protein RodA [Syntrophomonadaceae bacterium]
MQLNKRLLKNLDYILIIDIIVILGLSLLVLSSATANITSDPLYFVKKHLISIILGIACAVFLLFFDYAKVVRYNNYIYALLIILLILVEIKGITSHGAQQWINIGPLNFQPSEFGKIMMIVCFASYLVKRQGELKTFKDLIPSFLYFSVPFLLIVAQPDLGTALVFIAILFGMLYLAGANPKLLAGILFTGVAVVTLALVLHFSPLNFPLPLEKHQLNRLIAFVDPYKDPHGAGWNIIQSLVAIGSGGLLGKGLYHGTQVQLNFLPEHHTDFIFSVVGEELGFVGAAFLLLLYYILIVRTIRTAFRSRDLLGRLLVGGIFSMWLFHIFENIGMAIGVMPITGIPLPFMSYGGTAMLTNLIAVGIILNVQLRREKMLF